MTDGRTDGRTDRIAIAKTRYSIAAFARKKGSFFLKHRVYDNDFIFCTLAADQQNSQIIVLQYKTTIITQYKHKIVTVYSVT